MNLVEEIKIAVWVFDILRRMVTDVLDFVISDGPLLSSDNCPMMDLIIKTIGFSCCFGRGERFINRFVVEMGECIHDVLR